MLLFLAIGRFVAFMFFEKVLQRHMFMVPVIYYYYYLLYYYIHVYCKSNQSVTCTVTENVYVYLDTCICIFGYIYVYVYLYVSCLLYSQISHNLKQLTMLTSKLIFVSG